jgi:UDPglucose 6-dehydrogenase
MNISVIGSGYVGLVTGIYLASLGMNVLCCDVDEEKIKMLEKGILPIYEPELDGFFEKVRRHRSRIAFTTSIENAVKHSEVIFITVNTPTLEDNTCDISNVLNAAAEIARHMDDYKVIVNKSTVLPGTGRKVREKMLEVLSSLGKQADFDVVSNPEFLREGSAVYDFFNADRIVLGSDSQRAIDIMKQVYNDQIICHTPVIVTGIETSEMIKYASNAFLAGKVSFINEIAAICELCGADAVTVARGIGLDKRIGPQFLQPGPGFGGSCFPKDIKALIGFAEGIGYSPSILKSTIDVNKKQVIRMRDKISAALGGLKGRRITVLGVTFKPGTDDIRESSALAVIRLLLEDNAHVRVCDPKGINNTKKEYPDLTVRYYKDVYSACSQTDCIALLTDWDEYKKLDLERLRQIVRTPVFIDLRNSYDPDLVRSAGFYYEGVGVK